MPRFSRRFQAYTLFFSLFLAFPVQAGLIRDAEIEHTLRQFADPIFEAAGLSPTSVRVFIVGDDSINAYVAGGTNVFVHTGLLLATEEPGMLLGVLAHETGHIAGGHLARGAEELKNAQIGALLATLVGTAVAVGGKSGDAGMAILHAGQGTALRNLLSFSRANEQAADQAGLSYLDRLGISASGMLRMMETLRKQENRFYGEQTPYLRTHPLSSERVSVVRGHLERSALPPAAVPASMAEPFARMRAKLFAFVKSPTETFKRFPERDKSVEARMARAIAWFRTPDLPRALNEMNQLLKEHSSDAFLYDLKGQILIESGRSREAVAIYAKASGLAPDSALIRIDHARAILASEPSVAERAIAVQTLERATSMEPTIAGAWRLLAGAYGAGGDEGRARLALAEEAYLLNQPETVLREADAALRALPDTSPARLRAQDLKLLAERMKEEN